MKLTDRDVRVIDNLLQAWDDNEAPLEGSLSYFDVQALCKKLGLDFPPNTKRFLDEYSK